MLREFQDLGTSLGFSRQAYMMTNILSGAIWQLVNSEEIDIKNTTDLELQQHLLSFFELAVAKFVASNPDAVPEQAYQRYVAQRQNVIARAQYELNKLGLKKAPPKALPDLTNQPAKTNGKFHNIEDFDQFMITCDVCSEKGFPCVRTSVHGGSWTDGVIHVDDSRAAGLRYDKLREITDEGEAMALKSKYPNLKSLLHMYRPALKKAQSGQVKEPSAPTVKPKAKVIPEQDVKCTFEDCNLMGDIRAYKREGKPYKAVHHYDPIKQKYTYHLEQAIPESEFLARIENQRVKSKRIARIQFVAPDVREKPAEKPAPTTTGSQLGCPACGSTEKKKDGRKFNVATQSVIMLHKCAKCNRRYSDLTGIKK